jgi:plasmid stabilization system protein ParE
MSLPVALRLEAKLEFDEAFDWYERQRPGLGGSFAACVEEAFERVAKAPELGAKVLREVRRAAVRRFPYSLYYTVEADRIVVIAVFHGKRDPKVWQSRVS